MLTAREILKRVEENGETSYYIEDGILYHELDKMPFDVWDESKWQFIHATGREYWNEEAQNWYNEYEED